VNKIYKNFRLLAKKYDIHTNDEKTTSIHSINGDNLELSEMEKTLYMLLNYLSNSTPTEFTGAKNYILEEQKLNKYWDRINGTPSPSRAIGDIFWMDLPWQDIKQKLGKINILDIGCAKGSYCKKIYNWSNKTISSYTGIDIFRNKNWEGNVEWGKEKDLNVSFRQADIDTETDNFHSNIPENTNFIMSQSALEHIKNDLEVFKQIKKYLLKNNSSCIQLHLFPGPASLDLYLMHGYRQYGFYGIKRIIDLFSDFCTIELYKLCGKSSNKLHFDYITKPVYLYKTIDRRETESEEYRKLLKESIIEDMNKDNEKPAFWALKIVYDSGS